jgi:predicted Zn-dependent protease
MHRACRTILTCVLTAATTVATAKTPSSLPTYSWAYQPVGVDERGQWMQADEVERELRTSRLVIRDETLNNYVHGVLCRAVGDDRCKGVRIYIVRDPSLNAGMYANGAMQVNTGALLRVRGEAELAAVLAHEFGHFELRHGLEGFKRERAMGDALMWFAIAGGQNGSLLQLLIVGSFYRFTREQEKAADIKSFDYLAASPYRAGAGAEIWEHMMAERDATAAARKQRSHSAQRHTFYDTHPSNIERTTYLKELASKRGNEGDDGVEAYAKAMAKWRPQFLADQVKLNDFGGSEYILGALAYAGWNSDLLAARGDLYRLRGNPRDLVVAAQSYRDAIAKGATDPIIRRDLGMVLLRSGARADAATALQQYLALQPDATDKPMVAMLINQAGPTPGAPVMSAQATAPATPPAVAPVVPATAQAAVAGGATASMASGGAAPATAGGFSLASGSKSEGASK